MKLLIDNNENLKLLYSLIDNDQAKYLNNFKTEELYLQEKLSEINQLKLILNREEIDKIIKDYNESLNDFNLKVENLNIHYDKQINNFKNIIVSSILEILKKYSFDNEIDLILDSNNYILSSNSINITDLILKQMSTITLETKFEKYK